MTIEKNPQGNRQRSGKLKPIGSMILLGGLLIWMPWMFSGGWGSSVDQPQQVLPVETPTPVIESDFDEIVDCSKLSTNDCEIQIRFERKNREWLDSPEGRDSLKAIELTGGVRETPEK